MKIVRNYLLTNKIISNFVLLKIYNDMSKFSRQEEELIEAIRNLRKSKHNYSGEYEFYVRDLFESLLESDESD